MPLSRERISNGPFDAVVKLALLAVFDRVCARYHIDDDQDVDELAASICCLANAGNLASLEIEKFLLSRHQSRQWQEQNATDPLARLDLLIVENDPLLAVDLEHAVRKAGARHVETVTREQARAAVDGQHFDAVIIAPGPRKGSCNDLCARLRRAKIAYVIRSGLEATTLANLRGPVVPKTADLKVVIGTIRRAVVTAGISRSIASQHVFKC
jgi:pyrimidine deaminase RibD-like protein